MKAQVAALALLVAVASGVPQAPQARADDAASSDGWAPETSARQAEAAGTYGPRATMIFVTANIGRNYNRNLKVQEVLNHVKHKTNHAANGRPRFIGWQEIDEHDPAPEMRMLKEVYRKEWHWDRALYRRNSDGERRKLKVPTVARAAQRTHKRVKFGSSGYAGVSPTRYITITRHADQNISFINTHFIGGAYNGCPPKVQRNNDCGSLKDRWKDHWRRLKKQVAQEHDAGYNVVVMGDFNRWHSSTGWSPANMHQRAKRVRSHRVDHIVAIPRTGWKVLKARRSDGTVKQGRWNIGIDHHDAVWVALKFRRR